MDTLVVKAEEGRDTTTIVVGKASKACDPAVSELGNHGRGNTADQVPSGTWGEPGELKHLKYPEEKIFR